MLANNIDKVMYLTQMELSAFAFMIAIYMLIDLYEYLFENSSKNWNIVTIYIIFQKQIKTWLTKHLSVLCTLPKNTI